MSKPTQSSIIRSENIILLNKHRSALDRYSFSSHLKESNFLFQLMKSDRNFNCREAARKEFTPASKMHKRSQVMEILAINNQYLVALLENGRCSVHNLCKCLIQKSNSICVESKQIFFFNKTN